MTAHPSPEEVDAACVAARVPGAGISRMDMVAALEAAAEVREAAARTEQMLADDLGMNQWSLVVLKHLSVKTHAGLISGCQCGRLRMGQSYTEHLRAALTEAGVAP